MNIKAELDKEKQLLHQKIIEAITEFTDNTGLIVKNIKPVCIMDFQVNYISALIEISC